MCLIINSCSSNKKVSSLDTVDLASYDEKGLVIEKNTDTNYSPLINNDPTVNMQSDPIISLTVYSSLYNSLALIDLLKKLEDRDIRVSIFSSHGFASLLLCLYSKKESISYLEWKVFELQKKLSTTKPYSTRWKEILNKFIKNEFNGLKVQQLKRLVLIPSIIDGEIKLGKQGLISEKLIETLNLENETNYLNNSLKYSLKSFDLPVDIELYYYSMSKFVKFEKLDGINWGKLTKYLGFIQNQDFYDTSLIVDTSTIDVMSSVSDTESKFSKINDEYINKYLQAFDLWKKNQL